MIWLDLVLQLLEYAVIPLGFVALLTEQVLRTTK
jgi:hypothetical protein